MALKYTCKNTDCFASDLDDTCLLKKQKWFGFCFDYYPKIKSSNDEIFSHLFHKHNLKTRQFSIIAIIISMISIVIVCYTTVSSNGDKKSLEKSLINISETINNIGNNNNNRGEINSKNIKGKAVVK